jgi:hypothetical protein
MGTLQSNPEERNEVIHLLRYFEQTHSWRTSWIIEALKAEWDID